MKEFDDLIEIIKRLTDERDGCPWDKAQTHESIRINMIEEAYEAVDAIDSGDSKAIIEELGDVMLQSVLHADIARRSGEFAIEDVITALCNKLVSRHTHIFGRDRACNADEALSFWEKAKSKEVHKAADNFPATIRAQKLFKKLNKDKIDLKEVKQGMFKDMGKALFELIGLAGLCGVDAEVELNKYCTALENSQNSNENSQ